MRRPVTEHTLGHSSVININRLFCVIMNFLIVSQIYFPKIYLIFCSPCKTIVFIMRFLIPCFKPKRFPRFSRTWVIGTLRTKYLDPKQTKSTLHSFKGATHDYLTRTLQQYRAKKLHDVTVSSGFADQDASANGEIYQTKSLTTNSLQFFPSTCLSSHSSQIVRTISEAEGFGVTYAPLISTSIVSDSELGENTIRTSAA